MAYAGRPLTADRYGLLIMVGGVGCVSGDFSQTASNILCYNSKFHDIVIDQGS